MFKKRERPSSARQREDVGEGDGESGAVPATAAQKKVRPTGTSASGVESGLIGATTRKGDGDAASKLAAHTADSTFSGIKANGVRALTPADDVTRSVQIDTDASHDTRAKHERNQEIHKGLKDGTLEKGIYRGLGGYKQYAERGEGAIHAAKYNGLLGPVRNTLANVRSTLRIEHWGSSGDTGGVCKDYKETGYCGYGDSCKFAHDRSDYKAGYMLEKEWEEKQKVIEEKKRRRWERRMVKRTKAAEDGNEEAANAPSENSSDAESEEQDLPTVCAICEQKWENCGSIPVQTVCGHYFCEDCAMSNFARTPKCMTCDAPTNGIFNTCEALEAKIKHRKEAKVSQKVASSSSNAVPSGLYSVAIG